jgi:hypothetical protein
VSLSAGNDGSRAGAHLSRTRVPLVLRAQLVAEILVTYARVRWLMAADDIVTVVDTLRDDEPDSIGGEDAYRLGVRLARPVVRTLRPLPVDSRCLMRSLVLLRMMARREVRCQLVIGTTTAGAFGAHAWIEHNGRPLLSPMGHEPLTTI